LTDRPEIEKNVSAFSQPELFAAVSASSAPEE
jgi:hypothetical protein